MTAAPRTLLRALVAGLLLVAAGIVAPQAARADVGESIDVTITSHSMPLMDLSDPEQVVELSGTIINTSGTRIRYVNVNFWQSSDPITTRSGLDATLASEPTDPLGKRTDPNTEESGNVQVITHGDDEWFEPGDRAEFTVRATVAQLALPSDDAVYLLGVHVRGIPQRSTERVTVGRGRILTVATTRPLPVSPVVVLSATPTQLADGDFLDESLLADLEGRLETLLEAAERSGATLLLDPSLLAEAEALGEDHTVAGEETAGHESAAQWADRVHEFIDDGRALRLPFADADVLRAHAEGRLDLVLDWAAHAFTERAVQRLPLAVDLGGNASDQVVDALVQAGFTKVFADNVGGPGAGPVVGAAPMVQPGVGPGGRSSSVQQETRRLAEEFIAEVPRVYMIRTVDDAAELGELGNNVVVEVATASGTADLTPAVGSAEPWDALAAQLDELLSRSEFLLDLTGTDTSTTTELLAAKASSARFVDEAEALAWVDANPAADFDPAQVTISSAQQFVMGSRTNNFPMTITNGMPVEVTVRLTFDSDFPQRIVVPPTEFVTVQPGENLTLSVSPSASSNSVVTVHASLETRGGVAFGQVVPIEITATNLGSVGWIIILVSGAVVLGGTAWRIRAVRAENARLEQPTG